MAKWLEGDTGEDTPTGLSRCNAEFMTTIAGQLLGSLNIDVILQFARAVRAQIEEEADAAAEAAQAGTAIEPLEPEKAASREGLMLLNEVQEYVAKCTFVMVHNAMCARADFAEAEAAHRPALPAILPEEKLKRELPDKRPTLKERAAVTKNMEKRAVVMKASGPMGAAAAAKRKKQEKEDNEIPDADKAVIVPDALKLAFPTMRSLQTKTGQIVRLIMKCIEMGVGLEMAERGLDTITAVSYFAPFVIEDPKIIVNMIQQRMDAVQPVLCCLAANCSAHWVRECLTYKDMDTSFMFPLLTGNQITVRRNLIGFLANCSVHLDCLDFVMRSGMLRLFTNLAGRLYFVEQFSVILEMCRCLANLTSHQTEMHKHLNSEHVIAFTSDTLQFSFSFLHGIYTRPADEKQRRDKKAREEIRKRKEELRAARAQRAREEQYAPPLYESVVTFKETDKAPLGIKLRWVDPPICLGVVEGTPAARYENNVIPESHALIEVNGTEVQGMRQDEITKLLQIRPLRLLFRRQDVTAPKSSLAEQRTVDDILEHEEWMEIKKQRDKQESVDMAYAEEPDPLHVENLKLARKMGVDIEGDEDPEVDEHGLGRQLSSVTAGGDMVLYQECFHLCLIALHNLSCSAMCHQVLLQEAKILDFYIELMSSSVVTPELRRVVFSTLTNLARQQHVASKIFKAMTQYYLDHENIDTSLERYILLSANLLYINCPPELISPDRSTFLFISQIAETRFHIPEIRIILVETLHRMSLAPVELRSKFANREVLVILLKLVDSYGQFEVQVRAFEAAYFLTVGCTEEELWESVELIPRLWKAAQIKRKKAPKRNEEDVLYEMSLRTTALVCNRPSLVEQLCYIAEMDNFMMSLFEDGTKGEDLLHTTSHLMSLLLKTGRAQTFWAKWYQLGFLEKLAIEFQRYQNIQRRLRAQMADATALEDRTKSRFQPQTWAPEQMESAGGKLDGEFVNPQGSLHKSDFLTSIPLGMGADEKSKVVRYVCGTLSIVTGAEFYLLPIVPLPASQVHNAIPKHPNPLRVCKFYPIPICTTHSPPPHIAPHRRDTLSPRDFIPDVNSIPSRD